MVEVRLDVKAIRFSESADQWRTLAMEKIGSAEINLGSEDNHLMGIGRMFEVLPILEKAASMYRASADAWEEGEDVKYDEYAHSMKRGASDCESKIEESSKSVVKSIKLWIEKDSMSEAHRRICAYELERLARGWPVTSLPSLFNKDDFLSQPEAWGAEFTWMKNRG